MEPIYTVTGAFGYSGKYISRILLDKNIKVQTLTNSYQRSNPFGDKIKAYPFHFDDIDKLTKNLENTKVLINTYWVRFDHKSFNHNSAVDNTKILFEAAKRAGVERIIHTSITNPDIASPLPYFSGKGILEKALMDSGVSYCILRPAVLFGNEDVLINNIAWILRNFPIFGVFGNGEYRLQPIFVEDFAELAVQKSESRENEIINAIGPESYTYRELAKMIGKAIGKNKPIVQIPDWMGLLVAKIIGMIKNDVTLTRNEIEGLKADLLYVNSPSPAKTKLSEWVLLNKNSLGKKYSSEMARRLNLKNSYETL